MWSGLIVAISCVVAGCNQGVDAETLWTANDDMMFTASLERTLKRPAWDTAAILTPRQEGAAPFGFLVINGGFAYFDAMRQALIGFDQVGSETQTSVDALKPLPPIGRIRDLRSLADGRIAMLDADSASLIVLSSDWRSSKYIKLSQAVRVEQFAPYEASSFILWTYSDTLPFVVIDSAGKERSRRAFPWAAYENIPSIARGGQLVSDGDGQWAFTMSSGPGWVASKYATEARLAAFIEPIRFPVVMRSRTANRTSSRLGRYTPSAISSALSNGIVYILFGGATELRGRLIDIYHVEDGKYIGSVLLPTAAVAIAIRRDDLFALIADSSVYVLRVSTSSIPRR